MKTFKPLLILSRLIFRENPAALLWLLASGIVSTVQILFTVSIPKLMIDGYLQNYDFQRYALLILVIVAVRLMLSVLSKWIENRQSINREILNFQYIRLFSHKIMSIDYAHLEDPETLDLRERGQFALAAYRAFDLLFASLVEIISGLFTLLTVTVLLLAFSPTVFGIIAALTILSTLISRAGIRRAGELMKKVIPVNRVYNYYFGKAYDDAMQKDFRMFNLGPMIVRLVHQLNMDSNQWLMRMRMVRGKIAASQAVLQYLITLVIMLFAAYRTQGQLGGKLSVSDFTFFVGIAIQFTQSFLSAMNGVFQIAQSLDMLDPFVEFMQIPDSRMKSGNRQPGPLESLEFRNVSFRYPKAEKLVLEEVSFRIEQGEHISIVGINNAGKTTIVKLICRLFEPEAGEILYNGVPIWEYEYSSYLDQLATVFQDFQFFPFTLKENLGRDRTEQEIWERLAMVDMKHKVERLPHGLDTYLDKQVHEGGIDFSGGENQKLAIARSMLKEGQLMILDEPTAALDPFAESEIYQHFAQMVRGKTTVFISHRMSSSLFCDKILLLDQGKVVAFAGHAELMESDNLYRRLFQAQAQHYQSKSEGI
ncbi:ABC transporter ATP-binding protein [Proteiniclasticum sp. QWL-01]|uniref:ABC transporter ATP-binding protein n=1 Tax=Proteiniclasticum sp. QWL-01 TaxID=3036945 RepID=UPI0024111C65|nr:ABC transporter ATP-binding protein [Proteiniclasticum sp. QWL-01]WFF73715.1 ABC transporter ATP-binding protein [Proteiniclasticum sp. QWL-01]